MVDHFLVEVKPGESIKFYKDTEYVQDMIIGSIANFTDEPIVFEVTKFTERSFFFVTREAKPHIQFFPHSYKIIPASELETEVV